MRNLDFWVLGLFLAAAAAAVLVESKYMVYDTSAAIVPGKLNVHLVPHTHDDVGWLKTVDQYYVGSNNSIQGACVQNVLDSLIPALLADKNRKFIYVEQAFFQRWWRNQSPTMQSTVRELVKSGQLEFINGGWCMHDEAATHYIDMIDQTTLGHRYIKQQFNVTPRVGWQIDPFGHSAVQAYLLGTEVGFDSLYFGRIDYQDRAKRKGEKSLEVVWRASKSLGSSSQIFAGAFPENYEPPSGFYFEVNDDSPIVQDDTDLFDYNVPERVNDFVAAALSQANITRTNHVMWTMGTDFKYQYAQTWFRNLDKLIHYVNQDGRVNALYSTPSIYTDAKHASDQSWPLKTEDFFPYADRENAYWTGYFTSRPAIKGYVRLMSGYYLAARQLEFFKGRNEAGPTTDPLGDAMAIAQHHDAVSGTEQQHVANDYAKRLSIGYKKAEDVVTNALACVVEAKLKSGCKNVKTKFSQCPLLNISYCPQTEVDLSLGKNLVVVVYNSLGWKRTDVVRIPVSSETVAVWDSTGKEIESQVLPVLDASMSLRRYYAKAYVGKSSNTGPLYWLAFTATVPPLGFVTYTIHNNRHSVVDKGMETNHRLSMHQNDVIVAGPGNLKLIFSGNDGRLKKFVNDQKKINADVSQSYIYYSADDGSKDKDRDQYQAGGAYIFRPNGSFPLSNEVKVPLKVLRGPLYDEVHQTINSWIYQITRVYKEREHAEFEFTIGPIPIDDGVGKEVVTQITTGIKSNKTFYTDSNGRDFLERIRNHRGDWELQVNQPVAGNYYPINLGTYINDTKFELSILVDRSVGGSSLVDGQLELMLHRRLLHDDGRGVGEALNETVCVADDKCRGLTVRGKYYVRLDGTGGGARWRRSFGQEIYSPFLLAFSEQEGGDKFKISAFSGIDSSYSLPENVALVTLQELEDKTVLVRFAHLYEAGEDEDLSSMATVELKKVFPGRKIKKVKETGLSGNQGREEMEKKRLVWKVAGGSLDSSRGRPLDPVELVVELAPMEIRTFVVELSPTLSMKG